MNILKSITSLLFVVAIITLFDACEKSNPVPPLSVFTAIVADFQADPPSGGYDPTDGHPIGITNKFAFFSFVTRDAVSNADSATNKWDIGFRGTTIIINGGTSGPGNGGAIVLPGAFGDIKEAPDTGYAQDNSPTYAIPNTSNNGWYNYNPATNIISPIAGRTLIIKTAEAKYAKVEIISYYQGAPATPTSSSVSRYYTFRFLYQADGSKKLQ